MFPKGYHYGAAALSPQNRVLQSLAVILSVTIVQKKGDPSVQDGEVPKSNVYGTCEAVKPILQPTGAKIYCLFWQKNAISVLYPSKEEEGEEAKEKLVPTQPWTWVLLEALPEKLTSECRDLETRLETQDSALKQLAKLLEGAFSADFKAKGWWRGIESVLKKIGWLPKGVDSTESLHYLSFCLLESAGVVPYDAFVAVLSPLVGIQKKIDSVREDGKKSSGSDRTKERDDRWVKGVEISILNYVAIYNKIFAYRVLAPCFSGRMGSSDTEKAAKENMKNYIRAILDRGSSATADTRVEQDLVDYKDGLAPLLEKSVRLSQEFGILRVLAFEPQENGKYRIYSEHRFKSLAEVSRQHFEYGAKLVWARGLVSQLGELISRGFFPGSLSPDRIYFAAGGRPRISLFGPEHCCVEEDLRKSVADIAKMFSKDLYIPPETKEIKSAELHCRSLAITLHRLFYPCAGDAEAYKYVEGQGIRLEPGGMDIDIILEKLAKCGSPAELKGIRNLLDEMIGVLNSYST